MINYREYYMTNYNEFDPEVVRICKAMNCLPGIQTIESCCGHGVKPFMIFFKVFPTETNRNEGLFMLTRCVDRRYFKYGHEWHITLYVSDSYIDSQPPIIYLLESKTMGEVAYKQADALVDNIIHHSKHVNFLKLFELPEIDIIV